MIPGIHRLLRRGNHATIGALAPVFMALLKRQEDSLQWEQGMMTWARRNINSRLLNELLTISFQFLSFDDLKKAMLVWGGGGAAHLWSLLELNFCFCVFVGEEHNVAQGVHHKVPGACICLPQLSLSG